MRWDADAGLRLRMGVTLALIALLPFAFAYAFVFLVNTVGFELLELVTERPWNGTFYVRPSAVGGAVLVGFAAQYLFGDRIALRSAGARRIDPDEYPTLDATVARLASTADLPAPDVAVSRSDVPNAFTVGRSPDSATVVVTEGLLDSLGDAELEAVIAHELAHVKNRDAAVMTLAYFLPSLTYLVAMAAYLVLRGVFYALGSVGDVDDDGAKGLAVVIAVLTVSAALTLAVSVAFWIGSYLFFRVLSRYREYAADRGAAAITGDPAALASALRTLDDEMTDLPDRDLREQDGGLEALYVAPIDTYQFGSDRELLSSDLFPETHPPTEERVERLREIQREVATA